MTFGLGKSPAVITLATNRLRLLSDTYRCMFFYSKVLAYTKYALYKMRVPIGANIMTASKLIRCGYATAKSPMRLHAPVLLKASDMKCDKRPGG